MGMRQLRQSFIPTLITIGVSAVVMLGEIIFRQILVICAPCLVGKRVSPTGMCFASLSSEKSTMSLLPGDGLGPALPTPQQNLLFLSHPSLSGPGW